MRSDRTLGLVLRLSAWYDLVAFALLIWMPSWLLHALGHPLPCEPFQFRLSALPLLLLPLVYFAAAHDPLAHPELVRLSLQLRVVGAIAIAVLVLWQEPAAALPYWSFALADLAWALAYVLAALPAGLRLFGD